MPVIGEFHSKFWRGTVGGGPPPPAGDSSPGGPYLYQAAVHTAMAMSVVFGPPLDLLRTWWDGLMWWLALVRRIARLDVTHRMALLDVLDRLEGDTTLALHRSVAGVLSCDPEQRAVVDRAVAVVRGPLWGPAKAAVRDCATTPKFHQPEQWVEWSRAIKQNKGQAQNVFRHLKAVQAVRGLADADLPVSNPDAHLVVELAYQGFAAVQDTRKPARIIQHPVLHVTHADAS